MARTRESGPTNVYVGPNQQINRFLEHPWANISDTFLNLEGAASGG